MKCPTCKDVSLTISERQGIEIDYCGECRGIWLDRGELDKLIEHSQQFDASTAAPVLQAQPQAAQYRSEPSRYDQHRHEQNRHDQNRSHQSHPQDQYRQNKQCKSFLAELFD